MFEEAEPVVFAITFPFFISAAPSVCSLRVLLDRIYRIDRIKNLSRNPVNLVNPVWKTPRNSPRKHLSLSHISSSFRVFVLDRIYRIDRIKTASVSRNPVNLVNPV